MNATQLEFKSTGSGQSQCDKILAHLKANTGKWVEMPTLWRISGSMAIHSRIADLRSRGHSILHRNERKDGIVHSFYLYLEV